MSPETGAGREAGAGNRGASPESRPLGGETPDHPEHLQSASFFGFTPGRRDDRLEDDARHRARNTAENMTTLRHFALDIIKSDTKRKLGVANTRKRAGWDRNYLIELLTNA